MSFGHFDEIFEVCREVGRVQVSTQERKDESDESPK